jgi:DNA-binding transcriptional LysR family regulator
MDHEYALFAAVLEHGSLSAAARALRLSPAMASRRLARLEDRLGTRLLNRTTRRQSPTKAGEIFYRRVVEILAASREAEALVGGGARVAAGPLRITAPTSFGRMHVAPHLKAFLDRHPQVALRLDLSDAYVDLVGERYDLAIRVAARVEASVVGVRLASNRRVLCARTRRAGDASRPVGPPPAGRRRPVTLAIARTGRSRDGVDRQPRRHQLQRGGARTGLGRRRDRPAFDLGHP